jgi:hypothetical protein
VVAQRLTIARAPALAAPLLFGVLVVATVGAFFVTTRLKRSTPVVESVTFARHLSPNGDGRLDYLDIGFRIKRADEVTVSLVDADGDEVATLALDRELDAGRHRVRWRGKTNTGITAPDGEYRVRVGLRRQGRSVTSRRKVFVDTIPPRPVVRFVSPGFITPGAGSASQARLLFDGPRRARPGLLVYRTDLARPRLVARAEGRRGSAELVWDGLTDPGRRQAATGNYLLVARARDAAGNVGPTDLPPKRGAVKGHPGVVVRYVAARGPLEPVDGGEPVRFSVATARRRYRWRVRRLGSDRTLARGSSRAASLHLRAPRGRSGVFLLTIVTREHRYVTPFAVQAKRRGRVLVVLPALTWQSRNELDNDGDGFADVLPEDAAVPLRRPFAGSGFPDGFTAREAPLLLALDRARLRYDVTTDLALAGGRARPPIRYRGVLFAAAPRFFSPQLARLARSYVETGGRLAWLGTGGFANPVELGTRGIERVAGSASTGETSLGERLRSRKVRGALAVLNDRIQFFAGVGDVFGPFPALEQSRALPPGARLLASAGHEARRPALVVYRLRRGVVARVGVDGFARASLGSPDVARIMRRLWLLLTR